MKRFTAGRRLVFLLLIGTALLGAAIPAAARGRKEQVPDPSDTSGMRILDPIPIDPAVTTGKLSNGLTYYIRENSTPEDRAVLRLAVNAGSILENSLQQGLAHFAEHMAFNGTENFAKHQLIDYLESIGMEFGPDINAHTGFDETVYKLQIPTDDEEIMEKAFQILGDWAGGISFEPEEIDAERGVIIEEWRLGRGAEARMREEYLPVLLQGSRYADRLPIGRKEVVESFAHEILESFYDTWYRPDLMAVVAVGDFEQERILRLIRDNFSGLEMPGRPEERREYQVPPHEDTLFVTATDPEATNTVVDLFFKRETEEFETVEDYRELIKQRLFNMMFNARLQELMQQARPPFLYAASSAADFVRTLSIYELVCVVGDGGVETGLRALLTEAFRLRRHGFVPGELARAKNQFLSSMKRAFQEQDKTESVRLAEEYTRNFLDGEVIPGIEYEYELARRYSPGITLAELNALARDYITEENRVVLIKGPEKEGLRYPAEERLREILRSVEAAETEPYLDDVSEEGLFTEELVPGDIEESREYGSLGVTELTFSNGVRVLLKPTDFKNNEILVSGYSPGGTSLVSDEEYVSASLASTIVGASGVGRFSAVQLQKKLAGKQVHVSPYIGSLTEGFSGSCVPDDLEVLMQLIHLYGTAPREDREAFDSVKTRFKGLLQNRRSQPEALFQDKLQVLTAGGHFRERPFTPELLEELEYDTVFEIYRSRFSDFSDFVFLFAGNFSLPEMRDLCGTYLGTLPGTGRQETWRDPGIEFPDENVTAEISAGIERKSTVAVVFGGDFSWSPEREYVFNSLLTILDIRLRESIREEASGTYGVRVGGFAGPYPREEFRISVSFGCDPSRTGELTDLVFQELEKLKEEPPSELSLTKVREMDRRSYEEALKKNNFWVNSLQEADFYGLPYETIYRYPELAESLKGEQVKAMARQVFAAPYVQLTLYPKEEK